MADYPVGYKKPPVEHQFKPNVSGNKKGRPKRDGIDPASIIVGALNAPIEYDDAGRTKSASARALNAMMLVKRAVKGDVDAALALLRIRDQAHRIGGAETERLEISDWTPDFPGQTAEQKTQAYRAKKSAAPLEWWADPETPGPGATHDKPEAI